MCGMTGRARCAGSGLAACSGPHSLSGGPAQQPQDTIGEHLQPPPPPPRLGPHTTHTSPTSNIQPHPTTQQPKQPSPRQLSSQQPHNNDTHRPGRLSGAANIGQSYDPPHPPTHRPPIKPPSPPAYRRHLSITPWPRDFQQVAPSPLSAHSFDLIATLHFCPQSRTDFALI